MDKTGRFDLLLCIDLDINTSNTWLIIIAGPWVPYTRPAAVYCYKQLVITKPGICGCR